MYKCSVPENIHTPPTEGIRIFLGVGGGVCIAKHLKTCMKLNWNFQRGGGGGGLRKKFLLWGRYEYFLELHNLFKSYYKMKGKHEEAGEVVDLAI